MTKLWITATFAAAAACSQQAPLQNAGNEPANAPLPEAQPPAATNPRSPPVLPGDRTPLTKPKGPVDPKSAEAAGQLAQHYGALIEQRRVAEARKLWGSANSASQFELQLKRYTEAHLEIGKPGDSEGTAGSIYITVPAVFYGKDQNEAPFRRSADVVLRRVNDVPGSTEAQRRWQIERIEWKNPP